jgi:hypothetical protein
MNLNGRIDLSRAAIYNARRARNIRLSGFATLARRLPGIRINLERT